MIIQNPNILSVKYATENWWLIDPWSAFLLLELKLWGETHPTQGCNLKPSTGWLKNQIIFYFWLFSFSFSVRALDYLWLGFLLGQKAFWELRMNLYSSLVLSSLIPQSTSLGSALETQQLDPEEGVCMCCQACSFDDLEWFFESSVTFKSSAWAK